MAVLRNRRFPRMHPGCTNPLLKYPIFCPKYPTNIVKKRTAYVRTWGVGIALVPGTCTCSKIAKYPNIRSANPLVCCQIAKYPNIRSSNPLICCKIAKYPISESDVLYPDDAAKPKAQKPQKISQDCGSPTSKYGD